MCTVVPCVFNLCTRQNWGSSFTPRPLYSWVDTPQPTPRYPSQRRLGGNHSWFGGLGEEKVLLSLLLIELLFPGRPFSSLVTILTELSLSN